MNVYDALIQRKSTRAFLDKPVSRNSILRILDGARHAPSGTNAQPWQVAVLAGEQKRALQTALETAYRDGVKAHMDYAYYPQEWIEPYRARRRACGVQMYAALEIAREDKQKQLDQWAANYRAFDAPVMLLFFMDSIMKTGSYMDYGMFLQSIMLMAVEEGLATCPQAALGEYPDIVKSMLGYPQDVILIGGMALGYEDTRASVNHYRTERESVDSFTRFFD